MQSWTMAIVTARMPFCKSGCGLSHKCQLGSKALDITNPRVRLSTNRTHQHFIFPKAGVSDPINRGLVLSKSPGFTVKSLKELIFSYVKK